MPAPPPGFVLDQPQARPTPPPGFQLDQAQAEPGFLERAGNAALGVMFPHQRLGRAVGQQIERGGQAVMDLPGQVVEQLGNTATHYRNVGRAVGLPIEAPTPEAQQAYQREVADAALSVAGGAVGHFLGKGAAEIAKRVGRGFRTRAGAGRLMAREAQHVVPAGSQPATSVFRELEAPAITAGGTAAVVDYLDPTPWEFTDAPVAGGAGIGAAALAHREATENLLLQNPRWRDLVMRGTGSTPIATAIGATLGYLISKGVQLGAEGVDDVVRFVTEGEEPARGTAMAGPIGGPAAPVDEQTLMARMLMGNR